jgi:hypothetical protein
MVRPGLEAALSVLFGVMTVLTVIWPEWIEKLTGLDPDGGSSGTEWGIVLVLGAAAVSLALLSRRHFRPART